MQSFLKFRYFFILLILASCKQVQKKESEDAISNPDEKVSQVEATTDGKVILFFGNSLTAGYGLDTEESFPALIQDRIDSLGLDYTAINSGVSGETTSGGLNRLDWVLNQKVDVFILELGANDGLRGIPLKETRKNLQSIIDLVRRKNPNIEIILAGMQIPPNMGQAYTTEFRNIFPALAEKNDTHLIPFILDDVAGIPRLNLADGIHPTAEGQKIVANNVWKVLGELIQVASVTELN